MGNSNSNVFYRLKNSVETIAKSCWDKLSPEHKEKFTEATDATEHTHVVLPTADGKDVHLTHASDSNAAPIVMSSLAASL